MTVIITCPHCGRMEGWRETDGARTHCSFCHQPLSGQSQVTETPKSHAPPPPISPVLRYAILGGLSGALFALVITAMYSGYPTLMSVLALFDSNLSDDERSLVKDVVKQFGVQYLGISIAGGGLGLALMSLAGVILQDRPQQLRAAAIGAAVGSWPPPILVFVIIVAPAIGTNGLESPEMPEFLWHYWLLSLILACVGAVAGLFLCAGISAHRDGPKASE